MTLEMIKTEKLHEGIALGIQQGEKHGIMLGIAQGEKNGRHDEKIETARKLQSMGLTLDQISQATGLTIAEIKKNNI